jgi:hypothetical protein
VPCITVGYSSVSCCAALVMPVDLFPPRSNAVVV